MKLALWKANVPSNKFVALTLHQLKGIRTLLQFKWFLLMSLMLVCSTLVDLPTDTDVPLLKPFLFFFFYFIMSHDSKTYYTAGFLWCMGTHLKDKPTAAAYDVKKKKPLQIKLNLSQWNFLTCNLKHLLWSGFRSRLSSFRVDQWHLEPCVKCCCCDLPLRLKPTGKYPCFGARHPTIDPTCFNEHAHAPLSLWSLVPMLIALADYNKVCVTNFHRFAVVSTDANCQSCE